ncbi:MBOAT family protein [Helicobacter jaachi]|uniref:MBOAT family protein n=1 Tax=Helicobacter jaachi TaxID=1677920 RepID=A0A4V6I2R7_9HELI|nr:MBOAT family O-acyltransferase [Helicobacter jaachi]TLD97212.1 MBOAT family protein [Helicobacter jaachi]
MSFFSIEFSLLLLAFFMLYWLLQSLTLQNLALLCFNYIVIYLFNPYFALIVCIYTCLVYFLALFIDTMRSRFAFLCCVCVALLFLCFFKYYANIKDEFDALLALLGLDFIEADIIFPLGISFYTFASITYLCAVYEGSKNLMQDSYYEEGNPAIEGFIPLATYLSFFATFMAGPIMRSGFFFSQYHAKRSFGSIDSIIALIIFGVVKKAFIANYLEIYASPILNAPFEYHSLELLCALFAYSIQIYCDFSGYVNLMCAFGLMLGFHLPPNFNMPYMAKNIKDFWSRWHISLSTFIRDFIYIPLGGNRKGFINTQIFVLIAFGLSGLWHGNTWTFLLWGLLHGLGLVWLNCLKALEIDFSALPFVGALCTFLFVSFCWIFFYYHSLDEVGSFFVAFAQGFAKSAPLYVWWLLGAYFIIFLCYPLMRGSMEACAKVLSFIPFVIKPFVLCVIFTLIIGFMPSGIPNFIYASF